MLAKSLFVMGLSTFTVLSATAGSLESDSIIRALKSSYDHPTLYFDAKTTQKASPRDDIPGKEDLSFEQRYCRDGKRLDVTSSVIPLTAAGDEQSLGHTDRMVRTPSVQVSVKTAKSAETQPQITRKSPDEAGRGYARSLLRGGEALDGFLAQDVEALPRILQQAKTLTVRPATEPVDEVPCSVVEARSKYGHYTLWVDEQDGATVRKAEVVKNNGDCFSSARKLGQIKIDGTPVAQLRFTMDNVAVASIQGHSVPTAATLETTFVLADGRTHTVRQEHTREGVDLTPDFGAMDVFRVDAPK